MACSWLNLLEDMKRIGNEHTYVDYVSAGKLLMEEEYGYIDPTLNEVKDFCPEMT